MSKLQFSTGAWMNLKQSGAESPHSKCSPTAYTVSCRAPAGAWVDRVRNLIDQGADVEAKAAWGDTAFKQAGCR